MPSDLAVAPWALPSLERYERWKQVGRLTEGEARQFETILREANGLYWQVVGNEGSDYRTVRGIEEEAYRRIGAMLTLPQYDEFRRWIGVMVLDLAYELNKPGQLVSR